MVNQAIWTGGEYCQFAAQLGICTRVYAPRYGVKYSTERYNVYPLIIQTAAQFQINVLSYNFMSVSSKENIFLLKLVIKQDFHLQKESIT